MATADAPPPIVDCAVVLAYAIHDDSIRYAGRTCTYVNGELVGPNVRRSVIGKNLSDPENYLFIYCDEQWNSLAAVGYGELACAERCAERNYPGIEKVLVRVSPTGYEIESAWEAYWTGWRCSICRKWPHDVETMTRRDENWFCESCN